QSLLKYWPKGAEAARPENQEMQDGSVLFQHGIPTAYPLTSLVLFAPFTAISWPAFKVLWVAASVALFIASMWVLASWAGLNRSQNFIFSIGAILLAPVHTGIATCNPAIVAIEVGALSAWAARSGWVWTSGLLIAVCVGLKPQIGLCFLTFCVLHRY